MYINRGWVPRKLYSQQQWQLSPETEGNQDQKPQSGKEASQQNNKESWQRPEGLVSVVVVVGEPEKVRFGSVNFLHLFIFLLSAVFSYFKVPNRLKYVPSDVESLVLTI